jgi:hypothetical protein
MVLNPSGAYGMYAHNAELDQVMHSLNQSGFDNRDICMMVSPRHPIASVMREIGILDTERKDSGVAAGLMGWLFEFGAVMIPTVGFFIRSQSFLRALVARESENPRGNPRPLVGLGFSERDAERFEKQVREVGVLVYVSCPGKSNAARAVEVLRRTGAHAPALLEERTVMAPAMV